MASQDPGSEPANPADVEELRRRLEALKRRSENLVDEMARAAAPPPSVVLRNRIIGVAVLAAVIGVGYALGGWVGIAVALGALVAVPLLAVVVWHYGRPLVAGPSRNVGSVAVRLDPEERRAIVHSTFADEDRPIAALAYADRTLLYWSLGWRLGAAGTSLLASLQALAARSEPSDAAGAWTLEHGEGGERWIIVSKDRLGMGYSFTGTIGGHRPSPEDVNAACVAFVRDALAADREGRLAEALGALCVMWSKPPFKGGRAFRAAAKMLRR